MGPGPQYTDNNNKEKIQKVKIDKQHYVKTSLLKGGKPRPVLNRTSQTASTNLEKAKVKSD